jgi:ubiquinone biosynthesis protein
MPIELPDAATLGPLLAAFAGAGPGRTRAVAGFLRTADGRRLRSDLSRWITEAVGIEALVPAQYGEWRALVQECLQFVFSRLTAARLAAKVVEQFDLPPGTPTPVRLLKLMSEMPGIQKLGQVLARNRHLEPSLRAALSELENGMSDVTYDAVSVIIAKELGSRLKTYEVEVEPGILCEASVSAIVRFTWWNPSLLERERGVFKVLKPSVPRHFAEDMTLLQRLSDYLAKDRGHGVGSKEIAETVAEARLLLEHELDFPREQATLVTAFRMYRMSSGIRVPRPITELCTPVITAMTEERGVKVTDAFRRSPARRRRIAEQIIEALITVPLLSPEKNSLLHADPHAGNLFYDERSREIVILDWALTETLSRDTRRRLAMLAIMMMLRDPGRVSEQIQALSVTGDDRDQRKLIARRVGEFFAELPSHESPGALESMGLLDTLAMEGVRFPATLAMFRKVLFTLDGVLNDVAGSQVRMDHDIIREFLLRLAASFGLDHAPLTLPDFVAVQKSAMLFPLRSWPTRGSLVRSKRPPLG